MKLKHTIDDLDLWYQEHMRTRNHGSPRTGRDTANYRQINTGEISHMKECVATNDQLLIH